ncbi:helix-turn-helix domain-containing protein [Streptomyces hainanensis]|uniref:helix-turn-helix domain-containing protein n=1 Tax=Streptomyces hainanensis TaxID=402648 RepID=UPI001FB83394|nr:helix-turn-helix transcriptional regulator [Streptomyces hainanensis]
MPGHRLAEIRRARGLTQEQAAERMEVTKGRVSQTEQGRISGQEVPARYVAAPGGRPHQAISFDNGDIAAIAQPGAGAGAGAGATARRSAPAPPAAHRNSEPLIRGFSSGPHPAPLCCPA